MNTRVNTCEDVCAVQVHLRRRRTMIMFWIVYLPIVVYCSFSTDVSAQNEGSLCPSGFWGLYCKRECHCTEGFCDQDTGECANGQCSPGWAQPPSCQIACPSGTFGLRCSLICHCKDGDTCNHVNGMCSSGSCQYGWDGAGCQIKLPVFKSAPNATLDKDDLAVNVTWRQWSPVLDTGDPPVAQYTLEYSEDDKKTWQVATKVNVSMDRELYYHTMKVIKLRKYSFRLLVSRIDNEKLRPSIAGPSSTTMIICQRPSNTPVLLQVSPEAKSQDSGLLYASWQAPPDGSHNCHSFMNYVVKLWCDIPDKCKVRETTVPASSRTLTVSDLPLEAIIFVQVIAVNDAALRSYPSDNIAVVIRSNPATSESSQSKPVLSDASVTALTDTSGLLTFHDSDFKLGDANPYKVTLTVLETYLVGNTPASKTIFSQLQRIPLEGLSPSSHYGAVVEKLEETERAIANCSTAFWTAPVPPEFQDELTVESIDDNEITLQIPKVYSKASSSTRGLILFLEVQEGKDWQAAEVQDFIAVTNSQVASHDHAIFVAKVIPPQELSHSQIMSISSSTGFKFQRGKVYDLWYCVESSAGDQYESSCKPVKHSSVTKSCDSVFVFGRKPEGECSHTRSRVGLAFLAFFIIVFTILLILLCVYWKRTQLDKISIALRKHQLKFPAFGSTSSLVHADKMNTSVVSYGNSYQNLSCMGVVNVADIAIFLEQKQISNILLKDYFSQLPKNNLYRTDEGQKIENAHLNRSSLFLPYDKNRVQLPYCNSSGTDYINASVVKVTQGRSYIVTEAPTTVTAQRFWLMMWHCNAERIVMLVDLKEKIEPPCELYWNDEKRQTYGYMQVSVLSLKRYANYTVRVIELTHTKQKGDSVRLVHHYQYKNWDSTDNVPASVISFAEFVEVSGFDCNPGALCAVHCEYGTGRCGLFMLCEVLKSEAIKKGSINIFATTSRICAQRCSLIANVHQYKFVHTFLVESVLHHRQGLTSKDFMDHYKQIIINGDNAKLMSEFKDLDIADDRMDTGDASFLSNKFISPYSSPRINHPMHMASWRKRNLEFTELDSYLTPKGLLVSVSLFDTRQIPRLLERLWESETTTIVTFGHNDESTKFWPGNELEKTYDSVGLTVATTQLMRQKDFMIRELALTKQQGCLRPQRLMRQFHYTPWPWEKPLPDPRSFAKLVQDVASWWSQTSPSYAPVYIQCSDGFLRSGVFCVLWLVWERMLTEGKINVYQSVKAAQEANPDFVTTIEQYKLCYRVAKTMVQLKAVEEQEA